MTSRPMLFAAAIAALAASSPTLAQDDASSDDASSRLGEAMRDPAAQQATAAAATAMTEALLNIRVAPLLGAIEAARGETAGEVDPDLTLRDYAGPSVERVPEEVSRRLPAIMGGMGQMAGVFETMLPELRATARIMRESMDEALDR